MSAHYPARHWHRLSTGDDLAATVSGGHFFHMRPRKASGVLLDPDSPDRLLAACERISGIGLPDQAIQR